MRIVTKGGMMMVEKGDKKFACPAIIGRSLMDTAIRIRVDPFEFAFSNVKMMAESSKRST